jgi:hypothetical protein
MAQHMLDSDEVLLGDTVFDVVYGTGTVTELLADKRFRVTFAGNKRFVYREDGVRVDSKGRRTLYWHDPVVAIPVKDDISWTKLRQLMTAVLEVVRGWRTA